MRPPITRRGSIPADGAGDAPSEHEEPRPQPRPRPQPQPAPAGQGGSGEGGSRRGGSGRGGSGGGGSGPDEPTCAMTCAEAITLNLPMCPNAPQSSVDCHKALNDCVCSPDPTAGKCTAACANEACAGKDVVPGGACQKCIIDTQAGCGNEFNECANDI